MQLSPPHKQPEFKLNSSFHNHNGCVAQHRSLSHKNIITTIKHSVQVSGQIALPNKEKIKLTTQTNIYTARSQQLCIIKKVVFFVCLFVLSQEQVDFIKYIQASVHTATSANAPFFFFLFFLLIYSS